jgi:Zn-dependent peptidase ImmA (M78 family)
LNLGIASLTDDPEAVAATERKKFGVDLEEQREWSGPDVARRQWRKRIESRGVFTYMIPMPPDQLSGFSLFQGGLAAICVNDKDATEGAKIFTLFHEYCHLLLRQSGISDEEDNNRVERFCNEFAASFLIPRQALREAIGDIAFPAEFTDATVRRLAVRFRVSNRAVALRLEKTGLASKGFYGRKTTKWDPPKTLKPLIGPHQPSRIKIRLKRVGNLHAATTIHAVDRKIINSFDASQLIGVLPSSLGRIRAELG